MVIAHLLAFFNPGLRGLRSIEDVFDSPRLRRSYRSPRIPHSTLADAQRLFDPKLLLPLIRDLRDRIHIRGRRGRCRLDGITEKLLAVDGSFFVVAPRIAWALFNKASRKEGKHRDIRKGQVRLHLQFDVFDGLPEHASLTEGQGSEVKALMENLRSGALYVLDRGFQTYALPADILAAKSDFVVRLRKSATYEECKILPLTAQDRADGVIQDTAITLGGHPSAGKPLPRLRRVEIRTTSRDGQPGAMVLLSNRFDLSASMIAMIYRHRWQVELFFRWLKCVAHFEHFFSESADGMTIQVYVAIIGTLLIALETGARPNQYDYAMMSFVISGAMPLDEALEVMARRRAERARAAEWQRRYNAKKAARKNAT